MQGTHDDDSNNPCVSSETGVITVVSVSQGAHDDDVVITPVSVVRQGLLLSSACVGCT